MARKKTPAKDRPTTNQKLAIHDNSTLPKIRKGSEERVTFQQALDEADQTVEELKAPEPNERPTREAGMSNLACTIREHRGNYTTVLHPVNGKKTQNNGDPVAAALLLIPFTELMRFVYTRVTAGKYDHLNIGHQRMCAGNLVRGWYRKGDEQVLLWLETAQVRPADEVEPESEEEAA